MAGFVNGELMQHGDVGQPRKVGTFCEPADILARVAGHAKA
jgi:hypothetical protein